MQCPAHFCDTCYASYGCDDKNALGALEVCLRCPRAFHVNCIPPGARYNSVCLLCPLHPDKALPSKEKAKVERKANAYSFLWDQLVLPDQVPCKDDCLENHFKLPMSVQDDVRSRSIARPFR